MNTPAFAPTEVPFDAERDELIHSVDVGGEAVAVAVASVGNPHAVIQVEDLERAPVGRLGPGLALGCLLRLLLIQRFLKSNKHAQNVYSWWSADSQ